MAPNGRRFSLFCCPDLLLWSPLFSESVANSRSARRFWRSFKNKIFLLKLMLLFLYSKTFSNISSKNFIASVSIRRSISCFTDSEIIERNPFIVIFFVWVSLSVYKIEFSLSYWAIGIGIYHNLFVVLSVRWVICWWHKGLIRWIETTIRETIGPMRNWRPNWWRKNWHRRPVESNRGIWASCIVPSEIPMTKDFNIYLFIHNILTYTVHTEYFFNYLIKQTGRSIGVADYRSLLLVCSVLALHNWKDLEIVVDL